MIVQVLSLSISHQLPGVGFSSQPQRVSAAAKDAGARKRTAPESRIASVFMNDPFVMHAAQQAAARSLARQDLDDAGRIDLAYRSALGRAPSQAELQTSLGFIQSATAAGAKAEEAWTQLWQAIFASLDFRFLD